MRVTLMHNETAGAGSSPEEIESLLERAGCAVTYQSTKKPAFEEALELPADLVLIAGGDGTVTKVARRLAGRGVPFAVIPLGTSNNIASALGVHGTPEEIIAGLPSAERRRFDVGTARGPWGIRRFVESAGVGFFAAMLDDDARGVPESGGSAGREALDLGLRRLRRVLAEAPARACRVEADGRDLSGEYILTLALNVGCIGPRVWFAPDADPGDRRFDLLLAGPGDRDAIDAYFEEQILGRPTPFPVAATRAGRVLLSWVAGSGHLDDELWPETAAAAGDEPCAVVTLDVSDPPPLEVLLPR